MSAKENQLTKAISMIKSNDYNPEKKEIWWDTVI